MKITELLPLGEEREKKRVQFMNIIFKKSGQHIMRTQRREEAHRVGYGLAGGPGKGTDA